MQSRDHSTPVEMPSRDNESPPVLVVDNCLFWFYMCIFVGFLTLVFYLLYKYSVKGTLLSE